MPSFYSYSFRTSRMAFDQLAGSGALVASTYNRWQCFQYSSDHATTNAIIGEIGNNTLHNNEISLYIGIDHPDVPLAQLGSNGLTINSISDISNYKIHVKTWCNYFNKYTTAGLMLGSDLRDQGDVNMAPSNYSSNLNGFDFLNSNPSLHYSVKSFSVNQYYPLFPSINFSLFSISISNISINSPTSFNDNLCSDIPSYQRKSILLDSEKINLKTHISNLLTIYPNPFETEFRVVSSSVAIKEIELLDLIGRLVFKQDKINENNHLINFNSVPGCYLLKVVMVNGEVSYHKIVKSND